MGDWMPWEMLPETPHIDRDDVVRRALRLRDEARKSDTKLGSYPAVLVGGRWMESADVLRVLRNVGIPGCDVPLPQDPAR